MKLCRFSLPDDPRPRAGIFHDGKVYETDGENAIGVHAPEAVSLLTPIGHAASLRLFDAWGDGLFAYGNPGAIGPPEYEVWLPETDRGGCDVYLAAVLGASDREASAAEAERLILGYSILLGFSVGDTRQPSKLYDPGFVLGPFVVTPDELPAGVLGLKARLHLAGEVVATGEVAGMVLGFAEMIREASRGADVREGDVIAAGPIPGLSLPDAERSLRDGDVVIAVVENLGALAATARM